MLTLSPWNVTLLMRNGPRTNGLLHLLKRTPLVGFLAAFVTFLGAIEPLNYYDKAAENDQGSYTWRDISSVSPGYSPSPVLIWLLCIATWHYDIYYANHKDRVVVWALYHAARNLAIFGYGLYAIYDQLSRGWNNDWSPDQAAARYVLDKFFESIALAFFLRQWRDFQYYKYNVHRNEISTTPTVRDIFAYTPALLMASCWGWGRFLERNRPAYYIPRTSPQYPNTWPPWVPRYLKVATLPVGMAYGLFTSSGNLRQRFDKGLGKGVYMALLLLHSGAFGTYGSMRLTNITFLRWEQLLPFCSLLLVTAWQYRKDVIGFPIAGWKRFKNIFCNYHSDRDRQTLPSSSTPLIAPEELDPMLPPHWQMRVSDYASISEDNASVAT